MGRYIDKDTNQVIHAFYWDGNIKTLKKNVPYDDRLMYFKINRGIPTLSIKAPSDKDNYCREGDYVICSKYGYWSCTYGIFNHEYIKYGNQNKEKLHFKINVSPGVSKNNFSQIIDMIGTIPNTKTARSVIKSILDWDTSYFKKHYHVYVHFSKDDNGKTIFFNPFTKQYQSKNKKEPSILHYPNGIISHIASHFWAKENFTAKDIRIYIDKAIINNIISAIKKNPNKPNIYVFVKGFPLTATLAELVNYHIPCEDNLKQMEDDKDYSHISISPFNPKFIETGEKSMEKMEHKEQSIIEHCLLIIYKVHDFINKHFIIVYCLLILWSTFAFIKSTSKDFAGSYILTLFGSVFAIIGTHSGIKMNKEKHLAISKLFKWDIITIIGTLLLLIAVV